MSAIFIKSAFRPSDMPATKRPHIALVGRSNVGKSSLINHLANTKKLARTSGTPGLTNAINLYEFDKRYYLVDLPGYGYSAAARSRGKGFDQMIGDYLSEVEQVKLVLLVIDSRRGFEDDDRHALDQLEGANLPLAVVFNKVDKIKTSEVQSILKEFRSNYPEIPCLTHSTMSSKGLGELRDLIEKTVRAAEAPSS